MHSSKLIIFFLSFQQFWGCLYSYYWAGHCWFVTLMFILWIAHQLSIDLCKHHNVYNTYCLKFHLSFCKFQPKTLWSSVCSRDARPRDWSRLAAIFIVSVSPDISRDRWDWGQSILFHQLFFYFLYVLNWIVRFYFLFFASTFLH